MYLLCLDHVLNALLDKSGKKFAPKAPVRRSVAPGASSSTTTSSTFSVDRLPSQTSQLPEVQQHAAPTAPRAPTPTSTPSQQSSTPVAAPTSDIDAATLIPKPGSKTRSDIGSSIERSPQPSVTPRKRALNPSPLPDAEVPANGSLVAAGAPAPELSLPPPAAQEQEILRIATETSSTGPGIPATLLATSAKSLVSRRTEDGTQQEPSPAAKRQRTESRRRDARTGTDEIALTRRNEIPASTALEDLTTVAAPTPNIPKIFRVSKRKPSGRGKNKTQVEAQADETIVDTTQSSSSHAKKGTTPANKAVRKKRTKPVGPQTAEDAAAEIVAHAVERTAKTGRRRGRQRQTTPDDAEEVQIEVERVTMADLCRDPRTGKMSKAEAEFRAFEEDRARKRQEQIANGESFGDRVDQILEAAGVVPQPSSRPQATEPDEEQEYRSSQAVPETRIVNGEIVIDMDSLQVDRQALAEVQRNQVPTEIIEESSITRRVNYGTFSKKIAIIRWTEESTDLFYDGLRMFGTDFEMISKMFPDRTRRHIKLKFVKEERLNGARIKETLLGEKIPVDIDDLSKMSKIKFRDVEEFNRELDADRLELEERAAQERREKDDILQLRTDEAAAEAAAVGADSLSGDDDRDARDKTEGSLSAKGKHRNGSSTLPGGDAGPRHQSATTEVDSDGALDITNERAPAKKSRGKAARHAGTAGSKPTSRSAALHRGANTTRAPRGGRRNHLGILQSVE